MRARVSQPWRQNRLTRRKNVRWDRICPFVFIALFDESDSHGMLDQSAFQ
jgi:hypothetical protein